MSAVNAWIMYNDLSERTKTFFLPLVTDLSEELITKGLRTTIIISPKRGHSSKKENFLI